MSERSRAPIRITATRVGRTDLGDGTVVIDDDAIVITVRATVNERPIRLPLVLIDAARVEGEELSLLLRDGTRMSLVSPSAGNLCDDLLVRCRALPEVTRALRAFGSRRGNRGTRAATSGDQQRFFAPLLEARRKGGAAGGPVAVMAAFDAATLEQAIEEALASFVAERYAENGPARRALQAELTDVAEPLLVSLHALGEASVRASAAIDDLRLWRAWANQIRATFEVADRVWLALDVALDASPWGA
jgi:hypothetical protein